AATIAPSGQIRRTATRAPTAKYPAAMTHGGPARLPGGMTDGAHTSSWPTAITTTASAVSAASWDGGGARPRHATDAPAGSGRCPRPRGGAALILASEP